MAQKKRMSDQDRLREMKELFHFFDKNNNGVVSTYELEKGLQWDGNNPTAKEIDNLLKEMNVKRGQDIDFEKFKKCVEKYYENELDQDSEEKRLSNAFKIFDKNGNGTVEKGELKKVLTSIGDKLTDAEVDQMFREADINKDGLIQYKEFTKMFLKGMK
ncbi:calmodulin-A-like [Mercenaria mercenaria]|uniref:calmodulin-A-like n=1 Tax=Mercenaria mercenaria TaxID=6596 RepID=UPI00234F06EC|nr:calmodulin-A-like [Mercenaria mercenaria]